MWSDITLFRCFVVNLFAGFGYGFYFLSMFALVELENENLFREGSLYKWLTASTELFNQAVNSFRKENVSSVTGVLNSILFTGVE